MIGFGVGNEAFVPGMRFLTSRWGSPIFHLNGGSTRCAGLLHEVVERRDMTFTSRDHLGGMHEGRLRWSERPDLGKDERFMEKTIVWAESLPNAPFEQIEPLANALLGSDYRNPPYLLLCDTVLEDGTASCRMIHTALQGGASDGRRGRTEEDGAWPGRTVGNAYLLHQPVLIRPDADLPWVGWGEKPPSYHPSAGDLLIMAGPTLAASDEPVVLKANLMRIVGDMDEDSVGRWMPEAPDQTRRAFRWSLGTATRDDLEDEIERAYAREKPNEIIVICVPLPGGGTHNAHLSKSGIKLHEQDTVDDDLWGTALEPGVWFGSDISWYDCGDDGAEWEAAYRRATLEDLARHDLTLGEVADNWQDYAEDETPIGEAGIAAIIDRGLREEAEGRSALSADAAAGDPPTA